MEGGDISRLRLRFLVDDFISRVHAHKRERENGEFWGTFLSKFITFYAHEYITNMQQNTSASFKTCGVQRGVRANVFVERVGRRHGRQNNNSFNNNNNNKKKKSNSVRINDGFRRQRVQVKVTSAAGTTTGGNGDDNDETIKVILKVPDMMCEGCAESVTNALESSDSFSSSSSVKGEISIDLETKFVTVSVKGCASAVEAMGKIPEFVQALKENGFDSEPVFD